MNYNIEELPGSQRGVTKKICGPKIQRKVSKLFKKINRRGQFVHVNHLSINVLIDMSKRDIEQLIMEYNRK